MGVRVRNESLMVGGKDVCAAGIAIFGCVTVRHNEFNKKNNEKKSFKTKKLDSPYCNLPTHTHDTVVWVCGMLQCAKIHYCACTHTTCFEKPTGFLHL